MRPSTAPYTQTPRLGAPSDTALVRSNPAHCRRQIAQICGDRTARPSPFPDRCDTGILSVCDALCAHSSTRADFTLACVDLRSIPGRPDPGSTTVNLAPAPPIRGDWQWADHVSPRLPYISRGAHSWLTHTHSERVWAAAARTGQT